MTPYLDDGDVRLYHGDALALAAALPDGSVDCIVTSPPYWNLRDYGHDGQIGLESSPGEWVASLVAVFAECRRVLADHGTFWLNVGDAYCSTDKWGGGKSGNNGEHSSAGDGSIPSWAVRQKRQPIQDTKPKDLLGLPWMLAFALRADGWWLRSEIIWAKPNPMPESVTDRPTKSHEQVFLLTKQPRYFYDAEAIREEGKDWSHGGPGIGIATTEHYHPDNGGNGGLGSLAGRYKNGTQRPGRNARTVWTIATEAFPEAHFATYPTELVRRCIAAGCPERVCRTCGRPSERIVDRTPMVIDRSERTHDLGRARSSGTVIEHPTATTVGWTDCGHDNYRRGVVLDPFMGSGTTALAARRIGRHAVGFELNGEYLDIAAKRLQQLSLLGPVTS